MAFLDDNSPGGLSQSLSILMSLFGGGASSPGGFGGLSSLFPQRGAGQRGAVRRRPGTGGVFDERKSRFPGPSVFPGGLQAILSSLVQQNRLQDILSPPLSPQQGQQTPGGSIQGIISGIGQQNLGQQSLPQSPDLGNFQFNQSFPQSPDLGNFQLDNSNQSSASQFQQGIASQGPQVPQSPGSGIQGILSGLGRQNPRSRSLFIG